METPNQISYVSLMRIIIIGLLFLYLKTYINQKAKNKALRNENLMECVKNHLREGGLFLLDCFSPNIHYIVENEKGQVVIAEYTTADGREVLIKQTMRYENATQINRIEWHYFINGKFHSVQNLDMRLFFPQELDSYMKRAGFNIIHKFGGFEEEVFDHNSEKQIYVLALNK